MTMEKLMASTSCRSVRNRGGWVYFRERGAGRGGRARTRRRGRGHRSSWYPRVATGATTRLCAQARSATTSAYRSSSRRRRPRLHRRGRRPRVRLVLLLLGGSSSFRRPTCCRFSRVSSSQEEHNHHHRETIRGPRARDAALRPSVYPAGKIGDKNNFVFVCGTPTGLPE